MPGRMKVKQEERRRERSADTGRCRRRKAAQQHPDERVVKRERQARRTNPSIMYKVIICNTAGYCEDGREKQETNKCGESWLEEAEQLAGRRQLVINQPSARRPQIVCGRARA